MSNIHKTIKMYDMVIACDVRLDKLNELDLLRKEEFIEENNNLIDIGNELGLSLKSIDKDEPYFDKCNQIFCDNFYKLRNHLLKIMMDFNWEDYNKELIEKSVY